ncbi:MAG TPA: hypothetical protein VJH34_02840 [archaeon]|nr:hypothetical protein [archaeon]
MAVLDFYLLLLVNFFTFYAMIGIGIVLLVIGKYYSSMQKLTISWVLLAIGVVTAALRSLIDILIMSNSQLAQYISVWNPIFGLMGSLLVVGGLISLSLEKTIETTTLRRRQQEIKLILDNLRQKYLKKEISEEDLKKLNADLKKEIAEIEVRLKIDT